MTERLCYCFVAPVDDCPTHGVGILSDDAIDDFLEEAFSPNPSFEPSNLAERIEEQRKSLRKSLQLQTGRLPTSDGAERVRRHEQCPDDIPGCGGPKGYLTNMCHPCIRRMEDPKQQGGPPVSLGDGSEHRKYYGCECGLREKK